jgi:hypothetical protein
LGLRCTFLASTLPLGLRLLPLPLESTSFQETLDFLDPFPFDD